MEKHSQARFCFLSLANLFLQLGILGFELLLQALDIEVVAHASENFVNLKRFGDVVHPTHFKSVNFIGGIVEGTDKNHRNIASVGRCFQPPTHFVAIHFRHSNIEQNQVGGNDFHRLQRPATVGGLADFITVIAQHLREQAQVIGRIVHD